LYSFGQGGDACSRTRSNLTTQSEDTNALHVIAVDTGTWPNEVSPPLHNLTDTNLGFI
jgi:hypothetical protein